MQAADARKMILVLGMMAFWCNGDNYAAAPLLVEIARDLHLDISEAALSVIAYMLPFGLFTLIFGPRADRFGKARVINLAAFGTAVFSTLGAAAFDLASLSVIRAVNGAFAAAILPVTMSLIGDRFGHDPKEVQNALGKVLGMMFLGGASATAIGGTLAYLGSWRLVYLVYGIAELVTAFVMLRVLEKEPGTVARMNIRTAYQDAFANPALLKTVSIIFLVGASVFGSFTYAGKFVEIRTGYNILLVGLILSFFGLATVAGGRKAGVLRQKFGNKLLLAAGAFAGMAWALMSAWHSPVLLSLSLAGFGLGFIMIQPTLIATAQQLMPARRGTVMSLASFNMFVGGGIGTFINGKVLDAWGFEPIFIFAAALILLAGIIATVLLQKIAPVLPPRMQP
ncbi:MAG: MFS transporter [Desulfobacterales bacterium]|uniref:MFS transporter n=1 Tax=Candidatus Desulfatibia profunda TaxID=2841695 RepID=A0A8J6NKS3_9BACT|nr:MFS transporter [Candidatus Desulfatibia profunda]MBL7178609.1 MFS transporter [Desulfobacterales bacterium]